jgi:hypothetical protein
MIGWDYRFSVFADRLKTAHLNQNRFLSAPADERFGGFVAVPNGTGLA